MKEALSDHSHLSLHMCNCKLPARSLCTYIIRQLKNSYHNWQAIKLDILTLHGLCIVSQQRFQSCHLSVLTHMSHGSAGKNEISEAKPTIELGAEMEGYFVE